MTLELLRRLPLFEDVPDDDLEALLRTSRFVELAEGEHLMREGGDPAALYVVVSGEFSVSKRAGAEVVELNVCGAGEPLGEMSVLGERPHSATVRATKPSRLLEIPEEALRALVGGAGRGILRTVVRRLERQEQLLRQIETLAQLGELTRGLLHELNNPAAAVGRAMARLQDALAEWQRLTLELADVPRDRLERVAADAAARAGVGCPLDGLAEADLAADIELWLEQRAADDPGADRWARPWEVAATLAGLAWRIDELEAATAGMTPLQQAGVLRWAALSGELHRLIAQAGEGAGRISEMVAAVKDFTRVDEAPVDDVDVHRGLEATLTMLRYQLRDVEVVREYAPDLPRVPGYPGELNHVWSNLVDNAVDAMDDRGRLTLRTRRQDDEVVVEVIDTGHGIPKEALERIFEPTFTTKPVGEGTGQGLATVHRVVIERHGGSVKVASTPGQGTTFTVRLPMAARPGAARDA